MRRRLENHDCEKENLGVVKRVRAHSQVHNTMSPLANSKHPGQSLSGFKPFQLIITFLSCLDQLQCKLVERTLNVTDGAQSTYNLRCAHR